MKNKFLVIFTTLIILTVGLGCGLMDRVEKTATGSENTNTNKTLSDRAIDTVAGEDRIGVPECDEVMDYLSAEASNPDDNFVTKAVKKTALNKFRSQIKKGVEENNTNKVELANTCKDFKKNLDTFKSEEESNSSS